MCQIINLSDLQSGKHIQTAMKAVSNHSEPSFLNRYRDNHEAMYYMLKGTIREFLAVQELVKTQPQHEAAFNELRECLYEILDGR